MSFFSQRSFELIKNDFKDTEKLVIERAAISSVAPWLKKNQVTTGPTQLVLSKPKSFINRFCKVRLQFHNNLIHSEDLLLLDETFLVK